jgi:anti-sigma factor RsiW
MDHGEAKGLFPAYFAGRLDPATARELQRHIKDCEACRTRVGLERASIKAKPGRDERGLASPETQQQMSRNRDLLIKILMLMVFAYFVLKMKR